MTDNYKAYRTWSPDGVRWSDWVKPVLFSRPAYKLNGVPELPAVNWAPYPGGKSALIIDLPGDEGVLTGLALARVGYRPIPLYNGVLAQPHSMVVNSIDIAGALFSGADELAGLNIRQTAPPAFLLDYNRLDGKHFSSGQYDNRWCVFPQDMPSASYMQEQGINQIYVFKMKTGHIQNDLMHILRRYHEKGISVCSVDETGEHRELAVVKPSRFRSLLYRFAVMARLARNAAGGFGGSVPEATQYSGRRYYGIG